MSATGSRCGPGSLYNNFQDELVWKLTSGNVHTGSVGILAITDLSYDFEICSTGGKDENFHVSSFSITASRFPESSQ